MSAFRPLCLLFILVSAARAATTPATPAADASPWKTSVTLGTRIGYDDNVFLQDPSPVIAANGVPDRAGSMVGSATVGLTAAWQRDRAFGFDLGYSPELVRYERFASENHDDHRFNAGLHGDTGPLSYDFKGSFLLVDGADTSPIFGHAGCAPAIGGEQVRARRDQSLTKTSGRLTYAVAPSLFVRAVGATSSQDFGTQQKSTVLVPGYANYVDRAEWTVGADAGWRLTPDLALIAGVRRGAQRQGALIGSSSQSSNTLTRYLVGAEGKLHRTLTVSVLAGPDYRTFDNAAPIGADHTRHTEYAEANATWTPAAADAVTLTGKRYLWLSSGGKTPYDSTTCDVQWKHSFSKTWSASLAAGYQEGDNTDYVARSSFRDDHIYTITTGVGYAINARTKLDLSVMREWGVSEIAHQDGREYNHWLGNLALRYTF